MTATAGERTRSVRTAGLPLALLSAAAFGLSGPMAKSLLETGWTPGAVVLIRVGGAALLLLVPLLMILRRTGLPSGRETSRVVGYGMVAVAGAQLCFFSAVQHLSVGVALLLEYLAPVLLILWHWWRSRRRPARSVLIGAAVAVLGMVLVLDLADGLRLNPVGVAWGLAAAVCLSAYFVLADHSGGVAASSPMLMTAGGITVGAIVIALAGLTGVLPMAAATAPVSMGGADWPWWTPAAVLILISAVVAYLTGIMAVRRLGASTSSFVALTELIFAVVFAALLLAQRPSATQLVGGLLVLAGIAVVQRPRRRPAAPVSAPVPSTIVRCDSPGS